MADITKYAPINDFKAHFSFHRTTKRTIALAYAFVFIFLAFTILLAFSPSPNSSSPWFTNVFSLTATSHSSSSPSSSSSSIFSDESYRSHFSSIFYYFFPNSTDSENPSNAGSQKTGFSPPNINKGPPNEASNHKGEVLKPKNTTTLPNVNKNTNPPKPNSELSKGSSNSENQTQNNEKGGVLKQKEAQNSTIPPSVNQNVNKDTNPPKPTSELSKGSSNSQNQTQNSDKGGVLKQRQTQNKEKGGVLKQKETQNSQNLTAVGVPKPQQTANRTVNGIGEKGVVKNLTSSLMKKQGESDSKGKQSGIDDLVNSLKNCDLFDGNWVRDESYPLYKPGSCSLIDEQFNCFLNGRPDNGYHKLKWKPKGCSLPRLDGGHMLELLRGKRLVFVGDSLNRNMWESLICILRNSVKDQKKVYEENGRHHFRTEASYSFKFEDYKCTVEFFVSPFLVREWEVVDKNGTKKETLRLDMVGQTADKYKNADIIVFNTGHWWTHEKTSLGKDYYQEGSHVYSDLNVLEAFRKALTTWGRWIDANVNPMKSLVFFRGYSASHFSGGQWNSGGACDHETEPIKNDTYLTPYPPKMTMLERVMRGMKSPVTYLNVTRMTDYRKDGHPSIYRKQHYSEEEKKKPLIFQDCSHWCLPGVPDAWNEILYAELLVKLKQKP